MSKSVVIQEDGVAQNLSLDAIRLPKKDGGTEDWVPEDGKNLVNIRVKENGTYRASDFSAYGISEVRVACTYGGGSATSKEATKDLNDQSNSVIKEGGKARRFTVRLLETLLQNSGVCRWVRKAVVALGTKSINVDNKTYRAADDGYYGYSEVNVSGISIDRGTDDDGDDIVEHTDGTGTDTMKVPSRIALEPAPTKSVYAPGAAIDFTGMVVKAYLASGGLWTDENHPNGVIPFEELILTKQTAGDEWEGIWSDGNGVNAMMLYYTPHYYYYDDYQPGVEFLAFCHTPALGTVETQYGYIPATLGGSVERQPRRVLVTYYQNELYAAGIDAVAGLNIYGYNDGISEWGSIHGWHQIGATTTRAPANKFANCGSYRDFRDSIPESTKDPSTIDISDLHITGESIPVQWERPGDNEVLTTNFEITITQSGNSNSSDSGSS